MKYHKYNFSAKIIGERNGDLWDGRFGSQEFSKYFPDETNSLIPVLKKVCQGDFQDPMISPDTYIEVMLIKPNRRVIRTFDVSLFPSLQSYIRKEN